MDSSEEDSVRSTDKDSDERIEIADSSRDHDKNSTSSSSSSSSSDDESSEVKKKKKKESGESVSEAITANVIVESIGLMDSATPSDPNTEKVIEIATVGTVVSAENEESSLPKPNEITAEVSLASDEVKQASSSATTAVKKETEGKASSLAPEVSKESDATTSSHEEEGSVGPTHGVAERTSWLSCCGLFDVVTGSSR
ncbi:suppressor protein SRP40-like [Raphanus sativus]|uniref:Suppressor protein SRP40 isoform X3 n=1 Tax=Raphanus sativus TaxID=3726 RepID=A0A6J0MXM6_RAPSA|nr:suppressor protein SRP40 isoform X3 [Raphanus sativus]XP_056856211.1 suppressor protein SRP40-like isoform X3 [Raphanus sativus]XP_056864581.1 suppressor protein SRP40-like [Raphanus sativus]